MNAPCMNCTERTVEPNCHMTCERYLEYQKERQNVYAAKLENLVNSKGRQKWLVNCPTMRRPRKWN